MLYSNLNSNKYTKEKLQFDLIDTLNQKSDDSKQMLEIKFKFNKSEVAPNFNKQSIDTKKNMNEEHIYPE